MICEQYFKENLPRQGKYRRKYWKVYFYYVHVDTRFPTFVVAEHNNQALSLSSSTVGEEKI